MGQSVTPVAREARLLALSIDLLGAAGFDGYLKLHNPAWSRALGYSDEQLATTPYIDLIHPDDQAAARAESERQAFSLQPDGPFHGIEGLKHMATAIVPGIYDDRLADGDLRIATEDAHDMTRRLAREFGLFAGISSGAAAVAAARVAAASPGAVVVTIFPDGGGRYLSEAFWSDGQ